MRNAQRSLLLFGFGTVANGLIDVLETYHNDHPDALKFQICGVQTGSRGSLYCKNGLDHSALRKLDTKAPLCDFPESPSLVRNPLESFLLEQQADFQLELATGNMRTAQPALDRCRESLRRGRKLILADKSPAVFAWHELHSMAQNYGTAMGAEATVMAGTPCLNLLQHGLAGQRVHSLKGILNGSCNYIIGRMEQGLSMEQACRDADDLGYLEADHRADLDGWDSRSKVQILAHTVWGIELKAADVPCTGIMELDRDQVQEALNTGRRYKLLGQLNMSEDGLAASVELVLLEPGDELAQVPGKKNALQINTEALGAVLIKGPGAGARVTASALLADMLYLS